MKLRKPALDSKKGVLLKNTVMLYILQFSTYILGFLVTPYETRVLTKEFYGYLGTSTAIMTYFQLVIDFGFLLSATEEVSRVRHDTKRLHRIFTSVTICKLILAAGSFAVLLSLTELIPAWKQKQLLLVLTFFASFLLSMMPDYLYRGLEHMSAITVRTVLIRVFFTAALFVFLKKPSDICVIPLLNIIGNGVALVAAYLHLSRKLNIRFTKVTAHDVFRTFRQSATFFYSRIATTAYTALNTVILDIISQGGANTSFYNSANTLITAGKNGLSPISDSLYPYMARNRDFKLVKKVLLFFEPIIFVFCAAVFIWAEPLCIWFFGEGFGPTGPVLRAMLPIGVIILPSYILGFPTLTAMGLSKHANYSVVCGSAIHVCMLAMLYVTGNINMVSLGCTVSITEGIILLYRILVIFTHRDRMKKYSDKEV